MTEANLSPMPDEHLMPRIVAGDAEAFAELFRRRQRDVYRFLLHMSSSTAVAEDVTQDVFLQVMSDAARFDASRGTVGRWLFGIARNLLRQRFERERLLRPLDDAEDGRDRAVLSTTEDTLGDLTRSERIEALRRAIPSLPLRYREPVVLCDLQEISYADAAAILGCAIGTVRSRLHRGRALLAAKMAALEERPLAGDQDSRPNGRGGAKCFA
jgi:RNA polymerase sigma-70 factor (ECF subfamily)